ncbi:histidine phosphatase family protein [Rhodoferax sp.]|uniref:histidine phosphatase family protein n=1 Tax=Rhodoferax sp. TaxID=50421 RepID=UPI0025F8AF0C|nr:histidine phosphatase family protein [Rhodoferax sp.]
MSLWLLRHASPLVAPGTCYGRLDVAADPAATVAAAQAAAQALPQGARLRYSPLQRCVQLAQELLALRPDLAHDATEDPRLMEMDFGVHEGCAWSSIAPELVQAWTDDFSRHRFGGGESVEGMMGRVASAWDAYRLSPPGDEVWVTHAGVARAASLISQGRRSVERADAWPLDGPACGQLLCLP